MNNGSDRCVETGNPQPVHSTDVSFVVPARNEAAYIRETVTSIESLDTDHSYEIIVVDGQSDDRTPIIANEFDVTLCHDNGTGVGAARNCGAKRATGTWLAFIDADTRVRPNYLSTMIEFLESNDLDGATSHCRITGPRRARVMEWTINHILSNLDPPVLPGFNTVVSQSVFDRVGGFPHVPNEDTAFSRQLGRCARTAVCPTVLVETSGRRIRDSGLTGTLLHYLTLDIARIRATRTGSQ